VGDVIAFPVERCRPPGWARGRLGRNGQPLDWSEVATAERRLDELLRKYHRARAATQDFFAEHWPGVF
jgi:hypothetical protein